MSTKLEYRPLTIPKVAWDKKSLTSSYGEVVIQPLDPGFGITFGNALRRVLLGAIEGSAVTSVIVRGVNSEFSSLPDIVEDVMQLLLNIKGIVVRNTTGQSGKMHLSVIGEKTATVADIKTDKHIELVNGDHVIAHVVPGGALDIEFVVEPGRGYQPAQWPEGKSVQEDDRIYLDAMFSPVTQVQFNVEKTRVGKSIDHDKLTLRVNTNGSETPVDVLHYSVSVVRSQLEHFLSAAEIPFNDISELPPEEPVVETKIEEPETILDDVQIDLLLKPIDELELSARAHNCLINAGKKRILDLVNLSREEAMGLKNFGNKSLNEVEESLKTFGLSFGANIKEEDIEKALKNNTK